MFPSCAERQIRNLWIVALLLAVVLCPRPHEGLEDELGRLSYGIPSLCSKAATSEAPSSPLAPLPMSSPRSTRARRPRGNPSRAWSSNSAGSRSGCLQIHPCRQAGRSPPPDPQKANGEPAGPAVPTPDERMRSILTSNADPAQGSMIARLASAEIPPEFCGSPEYSMMELAFGAEGAAEFFRAVAKGASAPRKLLLVRRVASTRPARRRSPRRRRRIATRLRARAPDGDPAPAPSDLAPSAARAPGPCDRGCRS